MKKVVALVGVVAVALVGSAQAAKPPHPPKGPKSPPHHPAAPQHRQNCKLRSVDYRASGTLVSITGTTIEVNIKKANHHAATGDQTFTLGTSTKKKFHGFGSTTPPAGSKVKLRGKVAIQTNKNCPNAHAAPTASSVTLKQVDVNKH